MTGGLLFVGRVARAHGLKGEVIVELVSNRVERVQPGSVLHAGPRTLVVESSAPHQHRWRVRFEGVGGKDAADALHGVELYGEPLDVPGELWVHELIGSEVVDTTGLRLGTVEAIEDNPASDLLVLDGERLVPLTFVVEHGPGRVVVDPPAGLLGDD
jgi:16S rRNA processing protein RimM